jgi:hypothetical protein
MLGPGRKKITRLTGNKEFGPYEVFLRAILDFLAGHLQFLLNYKRSCFKLYCQKRSFKYF